MNNLLNKLFDSINKFRDRTALDDGLKSLTYLELDTQSTILAKKIIEITNDQLEIPVIIYMERSINFIVSILAVLKAGCYYIPVEYPSPKERLLNIIKDSNCSILLCDRQDIVSIYQMNIICYSAFLEEKVDTENIFPKANNQNLCYAIYTSGTTGKPKGVCIQYDSLFNLIEALNQKIYCNIPECSRIAVVSSFSFDASVKQIFCCMLFGHTLVICDKNSKYFGRKLLSFYKKQKIFLTDITPTLMNNIILQNNSYNKCDVQYFLIGGENLSWSTVYSFINKLGYQPHLINLYGPTEACVDVSSYELPLVKNNQQEKGYVPIGTSIANIKLDLLDEFGSITQNNQGELMISGLGVARGYMTHPMNNFGIHPEFPDMRTYRTGDLACRENGIYKIIGRVDDQVKVHGNRVELSEIAYTIKTHPAIKECFVFYENKKIYCFIQKSNKKMIDLYTYLLKYLPPYMIPHGAYMLKKFPINDNGKIDKVKLKQIFLKQNAISLKMVR